MESLMKYINRSSRSATLYRGSQLQECGLKGCQHAYIFQLCKHPGISQEQLAKNLCVNKSSVTRQLNSLEQNGFVTRRPSETDKRVLHVFPTEKAIGVLPKIRAISHDWNEKVLEGFTPEERTALLSMMERVMNNASTLALQEEEPQ